MIRALWLRIRRRRQLARDLEDEIAFHLATRQERLVEQGATPKDAALQARRAFGSPLGASESLRSMWTFHWLEELLQDLSFAVRSFAKNPVFVLAAVLSLALGIGAVTAIYAIGYSILWRPLPVDNPERLVALYQSSPKYDEPLSFSYPDVQEYFAQAGAFSDLVASTGVPLRVTGSDQPDLIWGQVMSGDFFTGLRLHMAAGRAFQPEDDGAVAVLSYSYWHRRYNADPGVVGRSIEINGHALTILGVTARGFTGTTTFQYAPDVMVPLHLQRVLLPNEGNYKDDRGNRWADVRGRLNPGITARQAEVAMNVVAERLAREHPETNRGLTVHIIPGGGRTNTWMVATGGIAAATSVMGGAVVLLLLISCTNVANLLLARGASRARELATRLAIGAGRGRLIRQLLTESLLLAISGGVAGLALAQVFSLSLWSFYPTLDYLTLDIDYERAMDGSVFLVAFAVSCAAVLLFGLAPALRASKVDQASAIKGEATGLNWRGRRVPASSWLVLAQVALSCVLLIAGGLFLRSLQYASKIDPGFDRDGLALFMVDLDLQGYSKEQGLAFQGELTRRLQHVAGVTSATVAAPMPLGPENSTFLVSVPGYAPQANENMGAGITRAGPRYFETVGTRIVAGRGVLETDTGTSNPVAVVNETFARRIWGSPGSALGRRFDFAKGTKSIEVVGVARDGKYQMIGEPPTPYAFFPIAQNYTGRIQFALRTRRPLESLLPAVRAEVRALDPTLAVLGMKTIPQFLERLLSIYQLGALLLGAFAASALLLSATGLFGLLHFQVTQRTREIGIRLALGAPRASVAFGILRRALILVGTGLVLGLSGAAALHELLGKMVAGVSGLDPLTYLVVALATVAIAFAASLLPARRAASIDPVRTLHWD